MVVIFKGTLFMVTLFEGVLFMETYYPVNSQAKPKIMQSLFI
jgi:hypothetical protein